MSATSEALSYGVKCGGCGEWVTGCKCPTNKSHYIAMGGLHGCIPSHCEVYETGEEAALALVDRYELGKKRERIFRRKGYLELNVKRDGNEYIEIVECTCSNLEEHSDE